MALPEQIRKQTEAVQELYKQLNDEENQGAQNVANGNTPSNESAYDNDPSAYENSGVNDAAHPAENTEQPSAGTQSSEDVVQKYRTLQGMYNAEVPRLHAHNREMQGRVQQLEQLLSSLSAQQQPQARQAQHDPLVTDQDVQEYGESLDVMRKVSREELMPVAQKIAQLEGMLRQMHTSVVPQVQAVAHRQAVTAEQKFWADITDNVPNWRAVNDTQAFQSWLLEVDPLTGITRQTYLEDAQRNLDTRRVISFFQAWGEINGQPTGARANRNTQGSELEKQVAPGRSRGSNPSNNSSAKTYSADDIKTFFNDVRSQKYKGRETERDRIERDIFAAQREGRIVV